MILDYLKRNEKSMIFSTILTVILGLVLLIKPEDSMRFITISLACVFLIIGIFMIIDYIKKEQSERLMSFSLILGIVFVCIGIFLFMRNDSLVNFITILIGFTIGLKSLFKFQYALNMKSVSSEWINNLLVSLIELVLAIVLVINPFESAAVFLRVVGGILLVGGILEIMQSITIIKELDKLQTAIDTGVTIDEVPDTEEVKVEKVKPKKTKKTSKKKKED